MDNFTLIVPFYRNCRMLERQIKEWNRYPAGVSIICVDDGSPEPALPIIEKNISAQIIQWLQLYRIEEDIPWNRGGARNLGARAAQTDWIIHVDIDHILPVSSAYDLLKFNADPEYWYCFPRWRIGKADDTRRKDKIPDDQEYGEIHPHVDSYLVRKDVYWEAGGYNEDYSGCLGGGNPFLQRLAMTREYQMLSKPIRLEVYTRDKIPDASDWSLSRDKTEYTRRKRLIGNRKGENPLRFTWNRQL